jgi:hypothetical protein
MELLVTLIGNAAVDPNFRTEFLANPVATVKKYGFRLTKGEYEMMTAVFNNHDREDLRHAFENLENKLYRRLPLTTDKAGHPAPVRQVSEIRAPAPMRPCTKPCAWSIQLEYSEVA